LEPIWRCHSPTAPTSLAVTGTTTTSVSLSWTASSDAVGVTAYDVYMDGILKTTVTGVTATIPGLTPSTTYAFYIIAKDAALNSSVASNTVNGTTAADSIAPTAPTVLTVTGTTSTTVSLSWVAGTDAGGVTGYDIYVNGILAASVTGLNTLITGLTPSTAYSFYVKAKDATPNYSPASNTVNSTTAAPAADTTAPAAPINLKITGVTGNSVSLSWDASTDDIGVTQYDVYMDSGYETTVTGLTATITGVTFSGTLAFNIIAKDAAGNSSPWVCH
jgi:chitodextrinase